MNKGGATRDHLIDQIINDPYFLILASGEILTRITTRGRTGDTWRVAGTAERHGGKTKYRYIRYRGKRLCAHRIVYRKFIGELRPDLSINHKDGDGLNNSIENLELVTTAENNRHRYQVLGYPGVKGFTKITQKIADAIRKDREKGLPLSALCAKYKLAKSTVSYIVNGKTWKAG